VPRTRTTKKLAQRVDMNYFLRPAPLRRWRLWLSVALPALAVLWLGWQALGRDAHVYSSGRLSPSHAVLTARCEVCHVRAAGGFTARTGDVACVACHDGPVHHANAAFTPSCASCHVEHRGAVRLAATADASCAQCHADLQTRSGAPSFVRDITSFASGHPEFAILREGRGDPTTIKLNHYRHLQPNLAGPNGPVQLACQDCHRTPADARAWPYGGAPSRVAAGAAKPDPLAPLPTSAYMAPPAFTQACAGCHSLQFDKRFTEGVPHDTPEVIHAFLVQRFQAYIAGHPAELREPRQSDRDLPEKPLPPEYRVLTPGQWVAERTAEAEQLLWRKTCRQCHALDASDGAALPKIAPSNMTVRFMPHARFNHAAHQLLDCAGCHVRAVASQDSVDLLLPGIATCRQCHRPGAQAAQSGCFECHTYHDQSQRHPAPGRFALPDLLKSAVGPSSDGVGITVAAK
jgi:hypothetical protein